MVTYGAYHEHYGGSYANESMGANIRLPAMSGPGCSRLVVLTATTTGLEASLPDATEWRAGGRMVYLICADGGNAFDVVDHDGTTIVTLDPGECVEILLADHSTAAGVWAARATTFEKGAALDADRQPLEYGFASALVDWDIAAYAINHGWDGVSPVALRVIVSSVIGASTTAAALRSGTFPSGSTMLLIVDGGSYVSGRGGDGGRGQDTPAATNAASGGAGGAAIHTSIDMAVVNYGTIQGGGGGGGGGASDAIAAGGGGGGGSGYLPSNGGAPGTGGGAFAGISGSLTTAGGGGAGANAGGTGGASGVAGNPGGGTFGFGLGGAAGPAIQYVTGRTVTMIRTGTVYGATVAV